MLDHISIGVRDVARSCRFYDAVLAPLGYRRLAGDDGSAGYGEKDISFWILAAERPVPAEPRSGLHISFVAPTRHGVDAFHAAALKEGGSDNGRPGVRADYGAGYYAAFAVDPDGYRIEAHADEKQR